MNAYLPRMGWRKHLATREEQQVANGSPSQVSRRFLIVVSC